MCKMNKKMYITGTDKEICLGDEVTYSLKVAFKKHPSLVFESEYTCNIDEKTLNDLVEEKFLTAKEDKPIEDYTTYLKWMAETKGYKSADVLSAFSVTLQLNPNAALSMLLKAISTKLYKGKTAIPRKVWMINIVTKEIFITDVKNPARLKNIAWFVTEEDAEYALKVCKPILKYSE